MATNSILNNLNVVEVLPIAAGGFATYRAFTHQDITSALLIGIPNLYMLSIAGSNEETLGSEAHTGFDVKNFGLMELACIGAIGWGAYRLAFQQDDVIAGVAAVAPLLLAFIEAGTSKGEF